MKAKDRPFDPDCPLIGDFASAQRGEPVIRDVYQESITNPNISDVNDAYTAFFNRTPRYVNVLMRVRNAIVRPFGFDTAVATAAVVPPDPAPGDTVGIFTVIARSDTEIVMGGADKRFSMRVSIAVNPEATVLTLATVAYPKDRLGTIYLTLVNPFHHVIAHTFAKRIASR